MDGCHAAGLGIIQDVVYNHLGPSGNYLPEFGPYLKSGGNTWGDQINLDGEGSAEVRHYILDNVRMWLDDYHVAGLRLDAGHALSDSSWRHPLEEMVVEVAALSAHQRRPLTLIAESDLNDPRLITPREAGGMGLDAQWSDDFHHAVHVALTGETNGYYADFAPLSALAKVCERGFFHDGTWSSFRARNHGHAVDTADTPTWRLVVCSQNHDPVGNRARGRPDHRGARRRPAGMRGPADAVRPVHANAVHGRGVGGLDAVPVLHLAPSPTSVAPRPRGGSGSSSGWAGTRRSCPIRRTWRRSPPPDSTGRKATTGRHATMLDVYRELGRLRRQRPELTDPRFGSVACSADEEIRLFTMRRGGLLLVVNFGDAPAEVAVDGIAVLVTDLEQIPLTADVEPWGVASVLPHHLPLGPAGERERRTAAR